MDVKKFIKQHPDMSSIIQLDEVISLARQGKWAETVGPLDKLAEESHPAAMYWLAMRYRSAHRIPNTDPNSRKRFTIIHSDRKKTVELMRQSAEKGYAPALHWMSRACHKGRWVEQDDIMGTVLVIQSEQKVCAHIPAP